jgi:hypothetical protein
MKFLDRLVPSASAARHGFISNWESYVKHAGSTYSLDFMAGSEPDEADGTFTDLVRKIHKQSGVIPAAVYARALLMSQTRFRFDHWSTPVTSVRPSQGSTMDLRALNAVGRSQMLLRIEQDVSYAGNAFVVRGRRGSLHRLDPSRVTFVLGSDSMPSWDKDVLKTVPYDMTTVAIKYNPNIDIYGDEESIVFLPGEYAHFMPEPDPIASWRGESWVASLTAEAALESQIVGHQSKFFARGTVPSLVFLTDGMDDEQLSDASRRADESFGGSNNAFKNMFLSNVTDVRNVSANFSEIGFDGLHGSIEVAVSMRSRIPAAILGTRDSLAGSSLNAGNFNSARRLLADGFLNPHTWALCEALTPLARPPSSAVVLAPDLSGVMFLQEDAADTAAILQSQMSAIGSAVTSGFDPEDAVAKVVAGDLTGLKHTGLASVQLQPLGEGGGTVVGDKNVDNEVPADESGVPDDGK